MKLIHWRCPEGFYTNPEVIAILAEKRIKASPQIFNPENFGPDTGDENVADETMRHNTGKPELSFILEFEEALDELAEVSRLGAIKYDRGNWKKGGPNVTLQSLCDSALRHMRAALAGDKRDKELGTLHVAQAAWNMLAATYWELENERVDDIEMLAPGGSPYVEVRRDEIEWNDKAKD